MNQVRVARMAEELRHQLSEILRMDLGDPRLSWVSVVRVELSSDLKHARAYVSVLGDEKNQEGSLRVLHRARGAIRADLAKRLPARRLPEIEFRADRSVQYSVRVLEILRELGFASDAEAAGSGEDVE